MGCDKTVQENAVIQASNTYICIRARAHTLIPRLLALGVAAVLVGCEGTVTLDMHSSPAADPAIAEVLVDLEGVELTGDGGTETLRFDDPVRVNLAEFVDGNLFRLVTDEQFPDGRYTGVRLLFADDSDDPEDVVILANGDDFPLTVADAAPSSVAFTVDKDDSTKEQVVMTLDLRQSLSFDDDSDEFALTPVVRSVRTEDTGEILGSVQVNCPAGTSLASGGAVYLFEGQNVTPDDRDGAGVEPYLTTGVAIDVSGRVFSYRLRYIPAGDYTLALTCDGNEEDASTDDNVRFQEIANVRVEAEETLTRNIGG